MAMISERLHRTPAVRPQTVGASKAPAAKRPEESPGRLVIGKGLEISGEISQCSVLKVAGLLRAKVEVEELVVERSGVFEGEASAERVRVAGRFTGRLKVGAELTVVAGGRIDGEVSYRGLQVEPGGVISGTMQEMDEVKHS